MTSPLVSICLPNLNTFPYLKERIDTIYEQSHTNWELIVVDSYSEDGSWELFEKLSAKDPRVSIFQAPRGLYASWNECVRRARGEYVYIATSDDTMAPDCLEKLVSALERHQDCDLAHCKLIIIDEEGRPAANPTWPECTVFAAGIPELVDSPHVRRAPHDGLLHLTGSMVYLSITQLLIRRSLFSRIGGFETRWGSMGDRNWEMKAGLVANTVHVPSTWSSWRVYDRQASANLDVLSAEHDRKIEEMIEDAVSYCEPLMSPAVVSALRTHWLASSREMRAYYSRLRLLKNVGRRRGFQLGQLLKGEKAMWSETIHRLQGKPKWTCRAAGEIRNWLESTGIVPLSPIAEL